MGCAVRAIDTYESLTHGSISPFYLFSPKPHIAGRSCALSQLGIYHSKSHTRKNNSKMEVSTITKINI